MLNPAWFALSVFALVGGVLVILMPKLVITLNNRLSKALVSLDELILRYRHWVGVALLIVAYLYFRLASVVAAAS